MREQVGLEPGDLMKNMKSAVQEREISLDIDQCFSNSATDAVVWDAGLVMLHYLARTWSDHFSTYHPLVLELGSGTGVVGLAIAAMGGRVILSDLPEVCETTLRPNVARNSTLYAVGAQAPGAGPTPASTPASSSSGLSAATDGGPKENKIAKMGGGSAAVVELDWSSDEAEKTRLYNRFVQMNADYYATPQGKRVVKRGKC